MLTSIIPVVLISIHAPRGGSDSEFYDGVMEAIEFQSTLPVGGATTELSPAWMPMCYFNPRSPWGERRGGVC